MTHRFALLWVALGLSLSLGGCMRPSALPPERLKPPAGEEWRATLQSRTDHWTAYQAKLGLRTESSKGKYSLRAVLLARLPDQFRLEAFNLWGQTIGVLLSQGGTTRLYVPNEKALYSSSRGERLIQHFLGLSIPPEAFLYPLIGTLPPDYLQALEMVPDPSRLLARSEPPHNNHWRIRWEFLAQPPALKTLQLNGVSGAFSIQYDPALPLYPLDTVPQKLLFLSSLWKMQVEVNQLQAVSQVQESLFSLSVPPGTRQVSVDEIP